MYDRLPEQLSEESRKRHEAKRTRKGIEFIKGPIRVEWVCRVTRLPRQAIATALALLFKAGVSGSAEGIPLTPQLLDRFGVSRRTSYRTLEALERARLVRVERHRGRAPRVTLLGAFLK